MDCLGASMPNKHRKDKAMKITPRPRFKKQGVDFADLAIKDWFIYDNHLCMKLPDEFESDETQCAIDITDGETYTDMCGEYVLPVDVEIKWKRKA